MNDRDGIFKNILDAVGNYIRSRSIGIWQEIEGKHPFIGSGTCVEIGDRLFIFTAAHNFQDVPNGGTFTLLSNNRSSQIPLTVISNYYGEFGKRDTLDAAWLEIDPRSAKQTDLKGISLELLDPYHTLLSDQNYQVVGLPFELNKSYREGDQEHFTIPFVLYNTIPSEKKNPKFDLSLNYSEFAIAEEGRTKMPHPGGISGGGIWYFPLDDDSLIWSADKCRFAGMVTHYLPRSQQICGSQIYRLLKLIYAEIPELREYVEPSLEIPR